MPGDPLLARPSAESVLPTRGRRSDSGSKCVNAVALKGEGRRRGASVAHHAFPIAFAFSGSYHQVPGAPEAYFGRVAGRENMSQ
jgi:hypothetical protein